MAKKKAPDESDHLLFESNASPVDCSLRGSNCLCTCPVCMADEESDGRGGTKDGHCHNFGTLCFVPATRFHSPRNFFISGRRP